MANPQIVESLTRKLGPLPVWVWGIAAGVTINVGRWAYSRHKNGASTDTPADTAAGAGAAIGSVATPATGGPLAAAPNAGAWNGAPASPAGILAPEHTATDMEWRSRATDRLIAAGYGPLDVAEALRRYLASEGLTPPQQTIVSEAIRLIGVPPETSPSLVAAPTQTTGIEAPKPPAQPPVTYDLSHDIAPIPGTETRPTLRNGTGTRSAPDATVSRLQRWANAATGARLKVDGIYGPKTEAWVKTLQTNNWDAPLAAGVVDANQWAMIDYLAGQTGKPF